jgi:hypothetical protein
MQLVPEPSDADPKGSVHSIIYDKSIGKLHFDYLATLLERHYRVSPVKLQRACREYFESLFPDFRDYFSATVFVYSDKEKLDMPNYFSSVDTREQPVWRPALD